MTELPLDGSCDGENIEFYDGHSLKDRSQRQLTNRGNSQFCRDPQQNRTMYPDYG
jgi:hypothetical protein